MNVKFHFLIAFSIRLSLVGYGYFQDAFFEVKYTDIDYQVFTDAAKYVSKGLSPYQRPTYRYTPFLAFMLVPNVTVNKAFGKILFCVFDIFTSVLMYRILKNNGFAAKLCRISTFMWLYNPMCMVISSRGNAESVMTFLIMLSIYLYQVNKPLPLGLVYGFAVHFKIYPGIYALSFYFAFSSSFKFFSGWEKFKILFYPNKSKMKFVVSSIFGFAFPTVVSVLLYKDEYIQEAFLYHLVRKDTRHNFSPYFYMLYLSESADAALSNILGTAAFLAQAFLIAVVSWMLYLPKLLPTWMFIETFIFVAYNKVCTSQYFLWYLCLFPLSYPLLNVHIKKIFYVFLIWLSSQGLWLLDAYHLELIGEHRFMLLHISSIYFFLINIVLVSLFIMYVSRSPAVINKKTKSE